MLDHASIPATVTKFFQVMTRTAPRGNSVPMFLSSRTWQPVDPNRNLLSLAAMRNDCPVFDDLERSDAEWTVIHVPRPSKKAMNPDRPANALLLAQISHLQHAERRLPLRYRSEIYTHAIRTEGEAAEYIREVTEAIHQAHADAAKRRAKRGPARDRNRRCRRTAEAEEHTQGEKEEQQARQRKK